VPPNGREFDDRNSPAGLATASRHRRGQSCSYDDEIETSLHTGVLPNMDAVPGLEAMNAGGSGLHKRQCYLNDWRSAFAVFP